MKSLQTNSPALPAFTPPGRKLTSLPVAARLRIDYDPDRTGFAFEPEGEFPRRVRQGEALARAGGFPLLAPRSGPVELDENARLFDLKVEGALRIGPGGERETLTKLEAVSGEAGFENFLDQLREAGIPSLDFDGRPLYRLFETAVRTDRLAVVLGTKDPESAIVWDQLLGDGFDETARLLETLLASRGEVLVRRFGGLGSFGLEPLERYGRFLPPVIARNVLPAAWDLVYERPLEEQGVVFLGPATLFALQNWLLHDRPFYSRPVVLRLDPKSAAGAGRFRRSPLHELPNGYPLNELFRAISRPDVTGIIAGDLVRRRGTVLPGSEIKHLNLFRHSAFYASRRHRRRYDLNLPCTGCQACQRLCPTGANPLALVEGRDKLFHPEACIECGLCTFVCDSAIAIDAAIRHRKSDKEPAV